MNNTENYQLSQWVQDDRIMMEDFNADNAKLEAALAEHAAALVKCGNCKFETFSYTGTATTGYQATVLNFSKPPILFLILGEDAMLIGSALYNSGVGFAYKENSGFQSVKLTWTGSQLTLNLGNLYYSVNRSGYTYRAVALLEASE